MWPPASPEERDQPQQARKSQAEIDAFLAKIDLLRAENEAKGKDLVRSWLTPETRAKVDAAEKRSKEEIDAEDARLFRPQPQHLGVGAEIPADFLASEAQTGNKNLRKKLLPSATLKASKRREETEKEASRKRGLMHESSDEDEGRSALGKRKKNKIGVVTGRGSSAVNPIISNGQMDTTYRNNLSTAGQGLLDPHTVEVFANTSDLAHKPTDPTDAIEDGEGQAPRKKRRKTKTKPHSSADEMKQAVFQRGEAQQPLHNIDENEVSAKFHLIPEPLETPTANAQPGDSANTKEQRKVEKKARKEERRRLKALE